MDALEAEFESALKRQKTVHGDAAAAVDKMLQDALELRRQLREAVEADGDGGGDAVMTEAEQASLLALGTRFQQQNQADMGTPFKKVQLGLVKFGKAIDRVMQPDITKALRDHSFEPALLHRAIAEHFFRQGEFAVGQRFAEEAGIEIDPTLRAPFEVLYKVLEAVRERQDLGPALEWTEENRGRLEAAGSDLEFRLHRLSFIHLVCQQACGDALKYARAHFARFAKSNLSDIQRLMGSLPYAKKLASSPYKDFLAHTNWSDVCYMFAKDFCSLRGFAEESPLKVCLSAGAIALPSLLKMASVLAGRSNFQSDGGLDRLAVEIELGNEYQFHSIFACPVSRELSSRDNPPTVLPCGHVLAKHSVQKLAKGSLRFKCPYCPSEQGMSLTKEIYF